MNPVNPVTDAPRGSKEWLEGVLRGERVRIDGERVSPEEARIAAEDASRYDSHRSAEAFERQLANTAQRPADSPKPFRSTPAAERLRAERSKLRLASTDRWHTAVAERLRYARDNGERLTDFLPPGRERSWLAFLYGPPGPASTVRRLAHIIVGVGLPVVLGALAWIAWSFPSGLLVASLSLAIVAGVLRKVSLAHVGVIATFGALGGLLGDAVGLGASWGAVILVAVALVFAGPARLPEHNGDGRWYSWKRPSSLSRWAVLAGLAMALAVTTIVEFWAAGKTWANPDRVAPAESVGDYVVIVLIVLVVGVIPFFLSWAAGIGLVLFALNLPNAVREAMSGTFDYAVLLRRIDTLPLMSTLHPLHAEVYGVDGEHSELILRKTDGR